MTIVLVINTQPKNPPKLFLDKPYPYPELILVMTGKNNIDQKIAEEEKAMHNDITNMMNDYEKERFNLIPVLQNIQEKYQYLSSEAIGIVANHLEISPCEVYGVATFYNQFRFNPPGKHQIKVCLGTACHVKSGDIILENFERKLEIKAGETTPDREFSIDKVACVGCCALAPVAIVDEKVHGYVAPSKVEGLFLGFEIEKQRKEKEADEIDSGKE